MKADRRIRPPSCSAEQPHGSMYPSSSPETTRTAAGLTEFSSNFSGFCAGARARRIGTGCRGRWLWALAPGGRRAAGAPDVSEHGRYQDGGGIEGDSRSESSPSTPSSRDRSRAPTYQDRHGNPHLGGPGMIRFDDDLAVDSNRGPSRAGRSPPCGNARPDSPPRTA